MKIAITGKSGMVGRHFPDSVIGLNTRLESSSDEMLSELQSLPQIDCLIHLAAMTLVSDCSKDPEKAHQLNVEGAVKWFEAAQKAGIKRFIFTSTSHVYGNPHTQIPLPTTWPLNPVNIYGKTKVEAERQLKLKAKNNPSTQLVIARMFSLLSKNAGPGLLYSNLFRRAREKDFSPVPGLSYIRDFLPAEKATERLLQLAKWNEAPEIVHICSGKARSILSLAEEVFAEYNLEAQKLLTEAPKNANDIPWLVGAPTAIPK